MLNSKNGARQGHDPYTIRSGAQKPPPADWISRCRYLGPSVVVSGSIVGSGELVLTSSLGAAAGFVLLWWVLLSCWSKSVVQAEFARYIVVSGDTYLRALNRIPGRIPGPRKPVSWTVWLGLLAFLPGVVGLGGILGSAGQAFTLLMPGQDSRLITAFIAVMTSLILCTGSYVRLERTMLLMVGCFTLATLIAALTMQMTEYNVSFQNLKEGMEFNFPLEHLGLALAVYGATGVNSAEISTYTYWCIEKGYPSFIGGDGRDPGRLARARGWIKILQFDIWVTLLILTCASLPFFFLGAGILHQTGLQPEGLETMAVLSGMFTETLGAGSLWLFGGAAFFIMFSSAVAGFGGTGRYLPDFLLEFGLLDRNDLAARRAWIAGYGAVVPIVGGLFYLVFQNPVMLLMVGALMGVVLLPVQSGATLWLQRNNMDAELRPSSFTRAFLWLTFGFQTLMASLLIWYLFFP